MNDRLLPSPNEEPRIERRGILLVGLAAAGVAACRADADISGGGGNPGADADTDGSATDNDTGAMDDASMDTGSSPDTATPDTGSPDTGPTCTPGRTSLGALTRFAMGTWTLLSSPRVIVAHDAGGLYAYSSVCTHSGCIVDPPDSSGQAFCACHGSLFDGNGAVLQGPARTPLSHYAVTVCDGIAYVDTSMRVSASTRTPV